MGAEKERGVTRSATLFASEKIIEERFAREDFCPRKGMGSDRIPYRVTRDETKEEAWAPGCIRRATRQGSRGAMTDCGRQQLKTPEENTSEFALMFCRLLPIPCSDGRCREGSHGNGRTAGDDAETAVPSGIAAPTMHGLRAAGAGRDAPSRGAGATAMGQWHRPAAPERSPGAPTPAPCDGHHPGRAGGIRGALHPAPKAPAMAITPSGSCCADGRRRATRTTQWGAA